MLPSSFTALIMYNQFILWRAVLRKNGKIDKVPYDRTGAKPGNAHDPSNWMSAAEAARMAAGLDGSFGVGFVFTDDDPFFFVDLDHCYDPKTDTWNSISQELVSSFQGACMEWSYSGTGVHIFGTYSRLLDHGNKNTSLDIELYTSKRFVALTGNELYPSSGDSSRNCSVQLQSLVRKYLKPNGVKPGTDTPIEWSTAPITPGTGLTAVDAVIDMLRKMQSPRSAFDPNRAQAIDLYEANEDILSRAYPSLNDDDPYDRSSADMALASHLAFLTGGNCELMREVMYKSELNRDKWHDRPVWLEETITKAASMCDEFYTPKAKRDTNIVLPGEAPLISLNLPSGSSDTDTDTHATYATGTDTTAPLVGVGILPVTQQIEYFKGCVYVSDLHRVFTPNGKLLKPDTFKTKYSGHKFIVENEGPTTKNAYEAFAENRAHKFPKADSTCFRPDLEPGAIYETQPGETSVNVFVPKWGKRVKGDARLMYDHFGKLLPNERDQQIILSWQAALVQYPGIKIPWAVMLQGIEGNGKSLIFKTLMHAIGRAYIHKLDANDITNVFNPWITGKILVWCEEIWVAGRRDVANILKPLITDEIVHYQAKRQDQVTASNCANFFLNSNEKDGVLKTATDRRYAVFYTAQQDPDDMRLMGMDESTGYFKRLHDWLDHDGGLAIWANELANYPISINLKGRAPITSSTEEAIRVSGGAATHILINAVESDEPGFTGGLIDVQDACDHLMRYGKKYSPRKVGDILRGMGYITHPALRHNRDGRVYAGGRKRSILCRRGSIVANLETPLNVANRWEQLRNESLLAGVSAKP